MEDNLFESSIPQIVERFPEFPDKRVTYSHSMVSATIVHPDKNSVLPLIPSFIEPQDGHEKQDCEREASKLDW